MLPSEKEIPQRGVRHSERYRKKSKPPNPSVVARSVAGGAETVVRAMNSHQTTHTKKNRKKIINACSVYLIKISLWRLSLSIKKYYDVLPKTHMKQGNKTNIIQQCKEKVHCVCY